eukprot:Blabericola_migrator_1__10879@NODE_627_length_7181_cov_106_322322_g458_i0_p4_GENE_NODE_627_length_7181_cov_106_322322_g458_i0NODE_627_length_7181_cov_106_322322_g458_i0_p4_ORF_typecomplete_len288_score58_15Myosin_tail_1/PF01576_19/0_031DUF3498/PF12004_8/0_063AAA_23/PF13476_6/0_45VPS38/PF17649_1/1_8DUF4619/PF15398_6/5_5_NODE_627_length_7181_cov_106_322322_g458_i043545217
MLSAQTGAVPRPQFMTQPPPPAPFVSSHPPPPNVINISSQSQPTLVEHKPSPPLQQLDPVLEAGKMIELAQSLGKVATSVSKEALADTLTLGTLLQSSLRQDCDAAITTSQSGDGNVPPTMTDDTSESTHNDQAAFSSRATWQLHEIRDAIRYLGDISEVIAKSSKATRSRLKALEVDVAVTNSEISIARRHLRDIEQSKLDNLEKLWEQLDAERSRAELQPKEIKEMLAVEARLRQEKKQILLALENEANEIIEDVKRLKERDDILIRSVEPIVNNFENICQTLQS